jgi:hypothetical protein
MQGSFNQEEIAQFKSNPYWAERSYVIPFLKAADALIENRKAQETLKRLDPRNIGKKIQSAANGSSLSGVSSATGGASSGEVEVTASMIETATQKQLKHYYKTGEWTSP